MKNSTLKMVIIVAGLSFGLMGCVGTQSLPSLTVGGKANQHKLLGVDVGKNGVGVVAPLVSVEVPFPTLTTNKK